MMNKYSDLYYVTVRILVYTAQKNVCQVCSLNNTFLCKLLYALLLLQKFHFLMPSYTLYYS
jgi:hypothetical protein